MQARTTRGEQIRMSREEEGSEMEIERGKYKHTQLPSQADDAKTLVRRVMNIMPNREQS